MHLFHRGTPDPGARRRVSYANVVATLALIAAIGGGTAWAAAHHYKITSTNQIKPSVLQKLRGANGNNGANGSPGATGATGATGVTGAAGAVNVVTSSNTNASITAIQGSVVDATATTTGHDLVIGQVGAHGPTGNSISCELVNVTAAPGTNVDTVSATLSGPSTVYVDMPLQASLAVHVGDVVAVECVGGNSGYGADTASISLIPLSS